MTNTKTSIVSFISLSLVTMAMVGCGSVIDLKKVGSQLSPTQQVTKTKVVKVTKKKAVPRKINSDCNYIIRDLSVQNAKDVWCIPRALQ